MAVALVQVPELNTIVREDAVAAMVVRGGSTSSSESSAPGDDGLAPRKPT